MLRQEALRHHVQYLIVDSVGLATDGPPDSSEQALSYFRTLRGLGVPGSLGIAHVTKNNEGADKKPFGSAYWHNLARMTWSAKGETSEPERPCVRLVNRKTNLTEALPDLRFQFDFNDERIVVSRLAAETDEPEASVADLSIRQRIIALLQNKEPMTAQAIAEALKAKEDRRSWIMGCRLSSSTATIPMKLPRFFAARGRNGSRDRTASASREYSGASRWLHRLVRIVEEKLVAVQILDDQQPITPLAILDRNAVGFELGAQRIERGDGDLVRLRLNVQGDEHQPLADLLRPLVGEDDGAALAVNLGDAHPAVVLEAPRDRESESVHIETERSLDV